MSKRRSRVLATIVASLFTASCSSSLPAIQPGTSPQTSPPPPVTSPAGRSVVIAASHHGQNFANAAITVLLAKDLSTVATGLTLDAEGRMVLPLSDKLQPGAVVVVQAQAGQATLSGLFTVPAGGFSAKQAGPDWLLDLATSVATRKLTSKLAEVVRSTPANGTDSGIQAVMAQVQALVQQTRDALQTAFQDARVTAALATAGQDPTSNNVEALANALIRYSTLQSAYVAAVAACNQQTVANLKNGGPLVIPAVWQVAEVQTPTPQVTVTGDDQVQVAYGNATVTLTLPQAAQALQRALASSTATTANGAFANVNTTVVPAPSSSGGGGGTGATVAAPTITTIKSAAGSPAGGMKVKITGTKFTGATRVTFGGDDGTDLTVDSDTQITVTTPARAPGAVDVVVTTPAGTATATNAFTYGVVMMTVAGTVNDRGDEGDDDLATKAKMGDLAAVAFDDAGNMYIADTGNHRIRVVCKTTGTYFGVAMTAGNIYTIAGDGTFNYGGDEDLATKSKLKAPTDVIFDADGNLYISDQYNDRVRVVCKTTGTYFGVAMEAGKIYTIAGGGNNNGEGVSATSAKLDKQKSIRFDSAGNLYIADSSSHRIRVVCKTAATYFGVAMTENNIYTIAGTGTQGISGNGGSASSAQLKFPAALAFDSVGNLYFADQLADGSDRIRVICKTPGTYFGVAMTADNLYTIAGGGTGSDGGLASDAKFVSIGCLSFDIAGNLYIADGNNHKIRVIGKNDAEYFGVQMTENNVYTVAGGGTDPGADETRLATDVRLSRPAGLAFNDIGELYFVDQYFRAGVITPRRLLN